MKKILKNVYYCDCCNKRGLSASHILKHERGCTNNIDRECGLCSNKSIRPTIDAFKARFSLEENALVNHIDGENQTHFVTWNADPITLEEVKKAADYCPNCTLAILRLTGLNRHYFELEKFNYKAEHSEWWSIRNPKEYDY